MLPHTYTTIRNVQKRSLLGLTDPKTNKPYVIGFPKHHMAQRACTWLPTEPLIKLQRGAHDNMTTEFNETLVEIGLGKFVVDNLMVDCGALLVVPKRSKGDIDDVEAINNYKVFNIPSEEFTLYPFERSIGIIVPQETVRETKKTITYLSMVIDPCFNANLFAKHLSSRTS